MSDQPTAEPDQNGPGHSEQAIQHSDGQQDTGNHKRPGTPEAGGADRLGGTRAGAENVEPTELKP